MQISLFDTDIDNKINETFIKDLKRGSGFAGGKERIKEFYSRNLSKDETIKLLKDEYGIGGMSSMAFPGGYRQDHDSSGIKITINDDVGELYTEHYSWIKVYDVLYQLINNGEY